MVFLRKHLYEDQPSSWDEPNDRNVEIYIIRVGDWFRILGEPNTQ